MPAKSTYKPSIERLESRDLLAGVSAYFTQGSLVISGTTGNDYISVTESNGQLSVYGAQITFVGGRKVGIEAAKVDRVFISSYSGNDTIIASSLSKQTIVASGAGNDSIYTGGGKDIVDAGEGNDLVSSGGGNDRITAGYKVGERDTLFGGGGFDWYYRPYDPMAPVVAGATFTDIRQGEAPLCQTAAALAEAAKQGHNFGNDIKAFTGTLFDVKLYGNLSRQQVYFDGWTNDHDLVPAAPGEFWTVLMQRARLQALGLNPTKEYTRAEWDAASLKTGGRLYSIGEALYHFTGSYPTYKEISAANPQALQSALQRGDYLIAQSRIGSGVSGDGIVRNHAYAVLGVYQEGGVWKVKLYNPWGRDRENGTTLDKLDKSPPADDGVITLSWQQFTNGDNFKGFHLAAKK